jgi:predicted ATPase
VAVPLPTDLHLPTTVQGVLASRIDRLAPEEKTLLQQLAVIGREFSLSLILHVLLQPEDELYRLLSSLQHKEFLYEQPAFPEVEYLFKHALTQEVAYNSVLIERRKTLHEQTARALEQLYHDRLEDHYDELAHHYSRSGNTEKAIEYLQKAGQQAIRRSVHGEAINHFTMALELLQTLPDTPARVQQELGLQVALGPALMTLKGAGAAEVGKAYTRAQELCRQIGETPQLFPVLWGLWFFYALRSELQTARELGEQLLSLAKEAQDSGLLLLAHRALANTLFWSGDFGLALEHAKQGIALHNPEQHRALALRYATSPAVSCLYYAAVALWHLGYPDQACKRSDDMVKLARELGHPHSLSTALAFATGVHQFCRNRQLVEQYVEAAMPLIMEHGYAFAAAICSFTRGWVQVEQGHNEEGIAEMRQGIETARSLGTDVERPYFLAPLAEAHAKAGRLEEGITLVAEALALVEKNGERQYEAGLYRVKGELTLQQDREQGMGNGEQARSTDPRPLIPDPQGEAEACFLKAIEVAQKQQAKSLELRATVSLARLWQSQGKQREAREILAGVYNWFTEGFDTKDLQEAKALLDSLVSGV